MAYSCCFLLHFLFIITLIVFLAFSPSNAENPKYAACKNLLYSCGDIKNVGYPFWGENRPKFCGISYYKLHCKSDKQKFPQIFVNNGSFIKLSVLGINISSHTMVFSQDNLFNNRKLKDLSIISILPTLKPEAGYTNLTLYYGCNNCTSRNHHSNSISCIDGTAYYFGNSRNTSDISSGGKRCSCKNNATVVVDKRVLDELKHSTNANASLKSILTKWPIQFEYMGNFTACSKCEKSGGKCGSPEDESSNEFVCYCRDGSHTLVCPKSDKKLDIALGLAGIGGGIFVLVTFIAIWFRKKKSGHSKFRTRSASLDSNMEDIAGLESLQFEFKVIKAATDNFSPSNKLGQGGFGVVYKGKLEDEQEIAVKRLSIYSGQGISEFKTEILLAAKLQHNNLAKLLGFSLHGEEKLLIYELLPNASLDKVLFGQNKVSLDWETRYKILLGTARGLLYLHEDSRLKIIHRDLKSSNILLDETMNPKITDFGLARLVGRDQIHADTSKIAGTYGYMAPEYALTGRFSVMSDVYSFGIIALEIISGHMCSSVAFPYHEESLPLRAWNLWKSNSTLDLVDPRLYGKFPGHKMERCIHISLLCIQEDSNKRPTMATIVSALNGHQVALSEPEPPLIGPSTNITFGSHQHLGVSSSGEFLSNSDKLIT